MTEPAESSKPTGVPGWVVVVAFLGFCFLVAAGTLALTYSAQFDKPEVQKPPEIGHELVPRQ